MKNILKLCFIAIALLLTQISMVSAQKIKIGQQCPDVTLRNIVNYKSTTAKISDFRGKLLIIDFWATWCSPCVGMIPKMDSLQKIFNSQIQIFPVTYQDEKTIKAFYEKYNNVRHILPYSATADTGMWKLFSPNELPHYIWIDPNGKVVAITGSGEVTAANIEKMLKGASVTLKEKKLKLDVDYLKPFFEVGTLVKDSVKGTYLDMIPDSSLLYHSVLTKYHGDGYSSGMRIGDSTRLSAFNFSIQELFKHCVGKFQYQYLFPALTSIETRDSSIVTTSLKGPAFFEWKRKHTYCYELRVPPALASKKAEIMTDELNRYFGMTLGIEAVMEKRMAKCLVLVRTSKEDKLASKQTGKEEFEANQYYYKDKGGIMLYLIRTLMLDMQMIQTPMVDGTDYTGKIDIELNCNTHNLEAVNAELAKYDLKFVLQDRMVDKIIIRDIPKDRLKPSL